MPYLSLAYLVLLLLLAAKWVRNYYYTKQFITTNLQPIDVKWQEFVNGMADRMNILQKVTLHLSNIAHSPVTIGYVKPVILLPVASINHLTCHQLEAVLLHELAHIKRSDYIVNLLLSVAEMILFFNPFTQMLSRIIRKERENCCDDRVLQYQYNAGMYAEALLHIAYAQKQQGFALSAARNTKGELLQRVKRMVQPAEKSFSYQHQVAALFVITALLLSVAWLHPDTNMIVRPGVNTMKTVNKNTVKIPLPTQPSNPFFSAPTMFDKPIRSEVNKSIANLAKAKADNIKQASLKQAQLALLQAAPAVLSAISSDDFKKAMKQAKEGTAESLRNIKWEELQKEIPLFIDSSFITRTVNTALAKANVKEGIRTGLAAAQLQLEKLQNNKTVAVVGNAGYLTQLSNEALASLKNFGFKPFADSIKTVTETLQATMKRQKAELEKEKLRQEIWMRIMKAQYRNAQKETEQNVPKHVVDPSSVTIEDALNNIEPQSTAEALSPATTIAAKLFSEAIFQRVNPMPAIAIRVTHHSDPSIVNVVVAQRR